MLANFSKIIQKSDNFKELRKNQNLQVWHKFVTLQVAMKNVALKYVSALLAVWYCVSIIGFDVHSCTATGSTFISSVLGGISCDDIHPDHDCNGHGACCGSHEADRHEYSCCSCHHDQAAGECVVEASSTGCCTNDIEVLDTLVVSTSNDEYQADMADSLPCLFVENDYVSFIQHSFDYIIYVSGSGGVPLPDRQAILNIWRI